jgi:hypothetical protein
MQSSLRFSKTPSPVSFYYPNPLQFNGLRSWKLLAVLSGVFLLCSSAPLRAQSTPVAHTLTLNNATETIDAQDRRVIVANVQGDMPGTLTLALVLGADGVVTGGEWALTVSYIQFGPPDADGDGDASESLVQRGVIKGAVSLGSSLLATDGQASNLSGILLSVTGGTLEFAGKSTGTGTLNGSSMNQQAASSGTLTISF